MVTLREVAPDKFINRLKEELKKVKEIEPLEWSKFAKSGSQKQRPPDQEDFWYIRSASILRRIYLEGMVGVQRLRSYYGGAKRGTYKGEHFRKSGGSILRKILQQLEKAGLVEKTKNGRKITAKGQRFLNGIAHEVSK
jgi:small subunit ribosomal protein S19e